MAGISKFITDFPLGIIVLLCLTVGLAPFSPPHIWEKLQMLARGRLVRPLDWFDFFLHGFPWILLAAKIVFLLKEK